MSHHSTVRLPAGLTPPATASPLDSASSFYRLTCQGMTHRSPVRPPAGSTLLAAVSPPDSTSASYSHSHPMDDTFFYSQTPSGFDTFRYSRSSRLDRIRSTVRPAPRNDTSSNSQTCPRDGSLSYSQTPSWFVTSRYSHSPHWLCMDNRSRCSQTSSVRHFFLQTYLRVWHIGWQSNLYGTSFLPQLVLPDDISCN